MGRRIVPETARCDHETAIGGSYPRQIVPVPIQQAHLNQTIRFPPVVIQCRKLQHSGVAEDFHPGRILLPAEKVAFGPHINVGHSLTHILACCHHKPGQSTFGNRRFILIDCQKWIGGRLTIVCNRDRCRSTQSSRNAITCSTKKLHFDGAIESGVRNLSGIDRIMSIPFQTKIDLLLIFFGFYRSNFFNGKLYIVHQCAAAPRGPDPESRRFPFCDRVVDRFHPDHRQTPTVTVIPVIVLDYDLNFLTVFSGTVQHPGNVTVSIRNPGPYSTAPLIFAVIHRWHVQETNRSTIEIERRWQVAGKILAPGPDIHIDRAIGVIGRCEFESDRIPLGDVGVDRFQCDYWNPAGAVVAFHDHDCRFAFLGDGVQRSGFNRGNNPAIFFIQPIIGGLKLNFEFGLTPKSISCRKRRRVRQVIPFGMPREVHISVERQVGVEPVLGHFTFGDPFEHRRN